MLIKGSRETVEKLRGLVRAWPEIARMLVWFSTLRGPGIVNGPRGPRFQGAPGAGDGDVILDGAPRRMRVKSISNDYLTCRTWDGTTEGGSDILVARPPMLRHVLANYAAMGITSLTSVNAQSVTASDGTTTETWRVTPDYTTNCEVYAIRGSRGGTGVTDADGNPVKWLDDNRDGRAWAKVLA